MRDIKHLVEIARTQIGTEEDPEHQNRGSAIRKYQASTTTGGQGWPWCAAFVDWCVQKLVAEGETPIADVPRTARAFGLISWAKDNDFQVFDPPNPRDPKRIEPRPGDIVVYDFSHCGIVSDMRDDCHDFFAIEGNTNPAGGRDGYEVAERGRSYRHVTKFIRLPV